MLRFYLALDALWLALLAQAAKLEYHCSCNAVLAHELLNGCRLMCCTVQAAARQRNGLATRSCSPDNL